MGNSSRQDPENDQTPYTIPSVDSVIKNLETQIALLKKEQAAPLGYFSSATLFFGKALEAVESRTINTKMGRNLQGVVQGATKISDTKIEVKIQALEKTLACVKAYDSLTTGSAAYLKSTFDQFRSLFVGNDNKSYNPALDEAYSFADREAASRDVNGSNLSRLATSFLETFSKENQEKDPFGLNVFNYPDAERQDFSEKQDQEEQKHHKMGP